eukprot:TRINITY_DN4957_c0_g1_i2.p1 TRINITY_DN4957_c0_g1~~TRINITY_DN4957_c0_g1_i2.p1  ORF type:complete len:128 (-),score=32.75 TRINITY_DN4957_c0_g1_i2:234-617(-)
MCIRDRSQKKGLKTNGFTKESGIYVRHELRNGIEEDQMITFEQFEAVNETDVSVFSLHCFAAISFFGNRIDRFQNVTNFDFNCLDSNSITGFMFAVSSPSIKSVEITSTIEVLWEEYRAIVNSMRQE